MKKQIKTLLIAAALSASSTAIANTPIYNNGVIKIEMTYQKIEKVGTLAGPHRTPAQIPNVYFNQETSTLLFDALCYECTLELVIPGTDTPVYLEEIPDGVDTLQLPDSLIGTYELRIVRGNYMFVGEIEL